MRERPNVCKYLDIALQHISDNMLKAMHRHVTKRETYELVERTAVIEYRIGREFEVAVKDINDLFGREVLGHRGKASYVNEQHGYLAALTAETQV